MDRSAASAFVSQRPRGSGRAEALPEVGAEQEHWWPENEGPPPERQIDGHEDIAGLTSGRQFTHETPRAECEREDWIEYGGGKYAPCAKLHVRQVMSLANAQVQLRAVGSPSATPLK